MLGCIRSKKENIDITKCKVSGTNKEFFIKFIKYRKYSKIKPFMCNTIP